MTNQTPAPAGTIIVLSPSLDRVGRIEAKGFDGFTERHHFTLPTIQYGPVTGVADILSDPASHVMVVMDHGLPNRGQLALGEQVLGRGKRFYVCWPNENAVELVDAERLVSLKRHRYVYALAYRLDALLVRLGIRKRKSDREVDFAKTVVSLLGDEAKSLEAHLKDGLKKLDRSAKDTGTAIETQKGIIAAKLADAQKALGGTDSGPAGAAVAASISALGALDTAAATLRGETTKVSTFLADGLPVLERIRGQSGEAVGSLDRIADHMRKPAAEIVADTNRPADLASIYSFLREIADDPRPAPFVPPFIPEATNRLPGTGLYLRLDFWVPLVSGGSYGHTCYQAQALAETTQDFLCVVANRFDMLDEMGLRQVVVPGQNMIQTEANILGMNMHYRDRLGVMFEAVKPAYIVERAVLGSAVGAWASRTFGIPYIVEYNGSEISMKRSFAGQGYEHENLLLLAEDAAFRQATMISVISDHVAADVARRRIPESKIVVNPNAVDLNAYCPATPAERKALRADLGFADEHKVVGFIGTFGGWHGIDVLSAALPLIARADPSIRFLLIGDGNMKNMVHDAIAKHKLADRVVDAGRVPQARGAELLKACDILVSPHSRNMVDSPFFGSPTKLFEYMAMGVGIVASDLEQIAHVMSPALRVRDFAGGLPKITDQRAIMCQPGDVDDFVAGVLTLARHPEISAALGRNARTAAERYYTWRQHVRNLWLAMSGKALEGYTVDRSIGTNG